MTDLLTKGYAAFSPCMTYRYDLVRVWDDTLPTFMVIMLNPSTADAEKDDPTTRKCLRYARDNGCGRYVAVNLFAFRSPEPKVMKAHEATSGTIMIALCYVEQHIEIAAKSGGPIVVAWGNDGAHNYEHKAMLDRLKRAGVEPLCFGVNNNGQPKHPTYIANGLPLLPYIEPVA